MTDNDSILQDLKRSVETWDNKLMKESVEKALDKGIDPKSIVSDGLSKGMDTISERFNNGEIFLPQVLAASNTMDEALAMLGPLMVADKNLYRGTVIMGSVRGDIHEIGKNVCCAMLRGAGYNVIDLGSDVPSDLFLKAAEEHSADVIGGSALMTTTLVAQKYIVEAVKQGKRTVLTVFGGAPCSSEWVDEIGGDGYSASGSEIVALVNRLMEEK